MKFWIRYGLGGGFGGCENCSWEEIDADNEEDALTQAYEAACQEYEGYAGNHGLRDIDEIMEEEGCDEDEANSVFEEERESWLDYEVSSVDPGNDN